MRIELPSALTSLTHGLIYLVLLAGCASQTPGNKQWLNYGPREISRDELSLYDARQDRTVHMTILAPDGNGVFPVVVFSHGAFCYPQQYANITDFWVSHGYVVVLPDHLDSPNGPKMQAQDVPKLLESRSRDMSFVLDSLDEIEIRLPQLRGRLSRDEYAVAGHSFGGMIAMLKSGLIMQNLADGTLVPLADERFEAAVVMSGVGQMEPMAAFPEVPVMAPDAFAGLVGPVFASGGTLDEGNVGTGQIYPWQWRMAAYNLAPPGDKYSLVLENADHYLGGLICRDNRGGEDDPVAVATVRAGQTAFLDAYIKTDNAALEWLRTTDFAALSDGRATLLYK